MKHVLFQSAIVGTRFATNILPGQAIEKEFDRPLVDMKVTSQIAQVARSAAGTIFITNDYNSPEAGHFDIKTFIPMVFEDSVLPIALGPEGLTPEIKEKIDYLIDYMIDSAEHGIDKAKEIASQYESIGYTCDWDKKMSIAPEENDDTPGKPKNIKRAIAAKHPVPKYEDTGFYVDKDIWYLLVRNIMRGENTMLIGPTGLI